MALLKPATLIGSFFILFSILLLTSCGKVKTERLLMNKRWMVYDVTPPSGTFNIETSNRAKELKNGFYKGAWFEFLSDSLFIASFNGKADTGKYVIRSSGKAVSLYPRYGHTIYEQMEIKKLSEKKLDFTTRVADFHMLLHLKAAPIKERQ